MARFGNSPVSPGASPAPAPTTPPPAASAVATTPPAASEEIGDDQFLYETLVEALAATPLPIRMKLGNHLNAGTPFEQLGPKVRAVLNATAQALWSEDEDEDEEGEEADE